MTSFVNPDFYSINRMVLAAKNPTLAKRLDKSGSVSDDVSVEHTKTDSLTLRYKGVLLHSMYDPVREAARFVKKQDVSDGDDVLVLGFGMGYHVREILNSVGDKGKVFVVEPNADILQVAFSVADFSEVLADARFYLISGENQESLAMRFVSTLENQMNSRIEDMDRIIVHEASMKCFPRGFEKLASTFEMLVMERSAEDVFRDVNISNFERNLDAIVTSPGIETLRDKIQGLPVFFINAGPSLDCALPFLKKFRKKALFACSDTAFPALVDQGINPDLVFSVDPQAISARHFQGCSCCDSVLVFMPTSSPEVVSSFSGRRMVFLQKDHSLTGKMEDVLSDKGMVLSGGSVSCMGLDILLGAGCKRFFLVGMDYAFSGGKMYSQNVWVGKQWVPRVNRFRSLMNLHYEGLQGEDIVMVDGYGNKRIPTHKTLYSYRRQLEYLIEGSPDCLFYNFMSQGAVLPGTQYVSVNDNLDVLFDQEIAVADLAEHCVDEAHANMLRIRLKETLHQVKSSNHSL